MSIASDEELPFTPVTQRLALLQVAMFDQLPDLIEILDHAFQAPASQSSQASNHMRTIEEHLSLMRRHVKASGLGLMWLGVIRTHCASASAQAVALNEMVARVIKLSVRRRMRTNKVLRHKEGDGTDVAQTPKEDCVLVLDTLNSILQDWHSFCCSSLILLMAAKFPGCLYETELKQPEALFSCVNPMLCIERVARLLRITLNIDAFRYAARTYSTGDTMFNSDTQQTSSLKQIVDATMKSVADSYASNSSHASVDSRLPSLTDDTVASSPISLKSHCPVALCQAVGFLLETRTLMLAAAGVMHQQTSQSVHSPQMPFLDQIQRARSVCDDAFLDASEQELLSTGGQRQVIRLSPITRIVSLMQPTQRKQALVQLKKMSSALHGVHLELLFNNSSCVFVMIECLLALSDVATGSSKSFFLRSALEWMESLWKYQEIASIRALRSFQNRKVTISQSNILKKLKNASSSAPQPGDLSVAKVDVQSSPEVSNASPEPVEQASIPAPSAKKYVNSAKATAAELAKEQERIERNMKDAERVYSRVRSKLYHASVFVSYMCFSCPSAIMSKLKGQWSNLIAGFEISYRKFISCVDQGAFGTKEVKRVLWYTMMLLKPLACEYRVLQSCHNPSAHFLLDVFDVFSRFAVTLDNTARAHFEQDFFSNYEPVFQPQTCLVIFTLSLSAVQLRRLLPNSTSVADTTTLLAEGSYYQLLHGELKTMTQEMQDTEEKHEISVREVLSLFSRSKKGSNAQQRRNDEAMQIVLSRLTQYSVSDDFLSVDLFDLEKRGASSVAMLIVCLMVQFNMHVQDINMADGTGHSSEKLKKLRCINLKHATITSDALHSMSVLLQSNNISYINCCGTIIHGGIPNSFAGLLTNVTHLDLQAIEFCDIEDDFILRKLLSAAVATSHVNLTYLHGVGDEELLALANASGSNLVSLKICQSNGVTDFGLCYLASRCSSLQHLHVVGCDSAAGHFIDFVSAYCPAMACFDVNFSCIHREYASLLPQLTNNHTARMGTLDVDLITKLGVLPTSEAIADYLKNYAFADRMKSQKSTSTSKESSSSSRQRTKSAITALKLTSPSSASSHGRIDVTTPSGALDATGAAESSETFDADAVVKVSVAEANRVFGNLERVNPEALKCIEHWISLLYGPSESNRAWLGRAEFAPSIMSKYDAATDDYLVIQDDDPEVELQFGEMLEDFTRRGLDSEQCLAEVKEVLLKRRIEQKENMMAERRLVAEMERDRRTLTTRSECGLPSLASKKHCFTCQSITLFARYLEIYHMSGRAAQDEDAVRRIQIEVEIATRRQAHLDRIRGNKGPGNIQFLPQSIMRVS